MEGLGLKARENFLLCCSLRVSNAKSGNLSLLRPGHLIHATLIIRRSTAAASGLSTGNLSLSATVICRPQGRLRVTSCILNDCSDINDILIDFNDINDISNVKSLTCRRMRIKAAAGRRSGQSCASRSFTSLHFTHLTH